MHVPVRLSVVEVFAERKCVHEPWVKVVGLVMLNPVAESSQHVQMWRLEKDIHFGINRLQFLPSFGGWPTSGLSVFAWVATTEAAPPVALFDRWALRTLISGARL
jgi:hypothetical protein